MGFVFIEANVKKWGLAPMTGSLAPPPPYGSEQGSILLESGRESGQVALWGHADTGHSRTRSGNIRMTYPTSPGPLRSPTDISLAQLPPSQQDIGEGSSRANNGGDGPDNEILRSVVGNGPVPPPEYTSPDLSPPNSQYHPQVAGDNIRPQSIHPPIPSYDAAVGNDRGRE
jgi:hypothetical protein